MLSNIQKEQKEWAYKNFGDQPSYHSFLGVVEELGELASAILKCEQSIRGGGSRHLFEAKARDAIGDLTIFLMGYCNKHDWELEGIVNEVWKEVKQRNWKKFPKNGIKE